ncbi:MAG: DNA methyltransferase [Anaerolineaceae bacterium]|nr:DNA methyltransferase [Anaerolineaceae bacterium]
MDHELEQPSLPLVDFQDIRQKPKNGTANRLETNDRAFHDWYRFVLAYPPHLVRAYLAEFGLKGNQTVLDPFCGTGTTLIEAKLSGLHSVGIEANPFAHFASKVKTNWDINPSELRTAANEIGTIVKTKYEDQGLGDSQFYDGNNPNLNLRRLSAEKEDLLIADSISPIPLHKSLMLLDEIQTHRTSDYFNHLVLAFANMLVFSASNLRFGPEVGIGKLKLDAPIVESWLVGTSKIADDIASIKQRSLPNSSIYLNDARVVGSFLQPTSIDAVITSPPYPNEKDYTRTTRLESVILGLYKNNQELRQFKQGLVRSNTRGVYKGDDDARWVDNIAEIQEIAEMIEKRRIELNKTSGFEKMYSRVTRLYFGGMARHLDGLRSVLKPGAKLAFVVGDQASYLRIFIPTGQLLSRIAETMGYRLIRIDLFRTRFATASKQQLREEVVILEWPG